MKKWLHVSDIHLNKKGVETRRIRAKLLQFLKERDIHCDYVFFTGDLRYAPDKEFANDTHVFLNNLCEAVNTSIENLFIVPGNHDVDRENAKRMEAVNEIWNGESKGYYNFKEGIIRSDDLIKLALGKQEFIEQIDKIYERNPDRILLYKNNLKPHFLVETDDFNILHIDSTMIYSANREENLIIGTDLLYEVCEQINQTKPTILLTHYSFDYMHRNEQKIILKIIEDYNIQLWFAGHEHDDLVRKQRDFFYEFQCGNLMYEGNETKSCIILGEYNSRDYSGNIQLFSWYEPDGWAIYPFINAVGPKKDTYQFILQNQESMVAQMRDIVQSPEYRKIGKDVYVYNLNDLNIETLKNMPEEEFCAVKEQLGTRLSGKETRQEIENLFLSEIHMSLNSNKRYDCMPMFQSVVRGTYRGFLYLDNSFSPLIDVEICHFFIDNTDIFQISSDIFQGNIITIDKEIAYITWGYQLSGYTDVADRLMRFEKVRQYLAANRVYIKMIGHEEYNLRFDVLFNRPIWEEMLNDTEFWYVYMQKIAKIELHYKIKFHLPQKATQDDYLAIDILSDSIDKKSCRHLPAIPMKNPGFHRRFVLEEAVLLNDASELPRLNLFGYTFKPISQYFLPGEFKWNKKLKGWESDFVNHGVAVGVDFVLTNEDDINRDLIQYIPFEDAKEEFVDGRIPILGAQEADFFKSYIKLTFDFQEIWQLYLEYKQQLDAFILYEMDEQQRLIFKQNGQPIDKATANEKTNAVVSAGSKLIKRIDVLCKELFLEEYQGENVFSSRFVNNNIGFIFMTMMTVYAREGHFPIKVDGKGGCYYNFLEIESIVDREENVTLKDGIGWINEEFKQNKIDLIKIPHYDILRNYIFVVAMVHKKYYDKIEPKMQEFVNTMNRILDLQPELIHKKGNFEGHVVYMLDGEEVIHAFDEKEDVMGDFQRYKTIANNDLSECAIGKIEKGNG